MSNSVFWNRYDRINLLIADDDDFNRLLIKSFLNKIPNIIFFEADNGEEALSIIQNHPIHVCLLDLHMPAMGGYEVMQSLQKIQHDTSILVITTDVEERQKSMSYGADDFIPKPFDLELLHKKIRNVMQNRPEKKPVVPSVNRPSKYEELEIEKSQIEFFYRLSLLAHRPNTLSELEMHTVSTLAKLFVEKNGGDKRAARNIYFASMIRNIGLINFTKRFDREHPFSPNDRHGYTDHILSGHQLLSNSIETPFLRMAKNIILQYREAYDGSGLPERLAGHAISQEAMIVKIVETFNALLSKRPYRIPERYTHKETYRLLHSKSATAFDPSLLNLFLSHYNDFYALRQKAIREFAAKHNIQGVTP